jgi:hypothetical protein
MQMQQVYRAVKCRERNHQAFRDVAGRMALKYTLHTAGDCGL